MSQAATVMLLAAVALSALSTSRANESTCGLWKTLSTCEDPEGNPLNGGVNSTFQMIGTVAGSFFMDFTRFNDNACTEPLLHVHTTGNFNDLGPISAALPGTRKFALNFSLAVVTPDTDIGVDTLAGRCQCDAGLPMSVISGSSYCEIDSNGCATDGAGSHGNNEACTIQVNVAGTLSATSFNTEDDYDYITIGSTRYQGSTGPSGVAVAAGSTFSWRSDSTVTNSGWTICLAPGYNGTPWAVGQSKVLATCDPDNCDIAFFGGTDIKFDQPAFGIVNVAADGGFVMGLMDIDPLTAFYGNPAPYLSYPTLEQGCVSESQTNLCGAFATSGTGDDACEVLLNPFTNAFIGTARVNYTYRGPVTVWPTLGQYGVYKRTVRYYSDARCTVLEATVDELGSMGYDSRDETNLLYTVQKMTSSFAVKPASTARTWGTVANLSNHCSCGETSVWGVGRARIITSCPPGTCDTPTFNDFNTPGSATHAFVARNSTSLSGEVVQNLMFGSWTDSQVMLDASGLKYAMKDVTTETSMQNLCTSAAFSTSLCGTYISACSNSGTNLDVVNEITLTGANSNQSSEGIVIYAQDIYNNSIAGGCAAHTKIYDIKGTGFFSQDDFANVPDVLGLLSVEVDFTAFTVTPLSADATASINSDHVGCRCGGSWAIGQPRTIYNCPAGSCTVAWMDNVLPGAVIGQPGFGVMQFSTVDEILRLSKLDPAQNTGYAMPFAAATTLMHQVEACPIATNPADFAGCWDMPCHRVDAGASSYAMSGEFDVTGASDEGDGASDIFFLNRFVYHTSSGCAGSDTKIVSVDAEGSFTRIRSSPNIVGGQVTALDIFYVTVTPINWAGVMALVSECQTCNQQWSVGTSVTFETTACDCAFLTTIAGIPIQKGIAYGATKVWEYATSDKVDDAFRMSTFTRDASSGSIATFTRANSQYVRTEAATCPSASPTSSPTTSPTSSPTTSPTNNPSTTSPTNSPSASPTSSPTPTAPATAVAQGSEVTRAIAIGAGALLFGVALTAIAFKQCVSSKGVAFKPWGSRRAGSLIISPEPVHGAFDGKQAPATARRIRPNPPPLPDPSPYLEVDSMDNGIVYDGSYIMPDGALYGGSYIVPDGSNDDMENVYDTRALPLRESPPASPNYIVPPPFDTLPRRPVRPW